MPQGTYASQERAKKGDSHWVSAMKLLESFFISLNSLSTAAEREGQRGGKVGQPARGYLHTDQSKLQTGLWVANASNEARSLLVEPQWTLRITLTVGQGGRKNLSWETKFENAKWFRSQEERRGRCDGVKWDEGLLLSLFGEGCLAKHEGGRRGRKTGKEILYLA